MLPGAIVEQVRNLNPRYDEEKTAENYNVQFGKAMERVGGPNWKQKRHFKHPTALLWVESSPPHVLCCMSIPVSFMEMANPNWQFAHAL